MKAERPFVTAGVALLGTGVVAITPIAPPPDVDIASPAARLTAASASLANVPVNVIQAIANIPANELAAMQSMANALLFTGSWWTGRPNQIWGTDPADPPKWKAGVAMLVPFPALSGPLGEQVAVFTQAEFPVHPDCHYICHDPVPILQGLFQVPLWQLISGYTFPTVVNPLGPVEGEYGFPGTGPGNTMPWSGQTVQIDPLEPITSVINYLVSPPSGIKPVSVEDVVTTAMNLGAALIVDFSPFTPGGPFTPGWPYSREACPACYEIDESPAAATSIPSLIPNLGRTFTMNAASIAPGGDVQQNVVKNVVTGNDVASTNAKQDGLVAGTATEVSSNASGVLETVSKTVNPEAGRGLNIPNIAVKKTKPSTNVVRDGNEVEPGQSGGRHRKPTGGLAGAVKSVSDRISSSVSKVTDGLKGGRAETGKASTDGTSAGKSSTDGTTK